MTALIVPVIVLGSAAAAIIMIYRALRRLFAVLNPAWLWFTGMPMDGVARTNATWLSRSHGDRAVLHHSGYAHPWHHLPRLTRAGIRTAATILLIVIAYGLITATTATIACLAATAAAAAAVACWHAWYRIRHWKHERHHVRPLERTLTAALGVPPITLEVEMADDGAVKSVAIEWAPKTEIDPGDKPRILEAVTTRLPIESPEPEWQLEGRKRAVTLTPSPPPPSYVSWDDVYAAVRAAAASELVFGTGKRNTVTKAGYSESPHVAIPGGSGGGKSNLAAFLLLQEMMRGSLIVNLDPKWISHLWLKGLPNVINAHDIPDLHLALSWLGRELLRRTRAVYYSAGATGRVRARPGDRIIVLCEELNYGMPGLKEYWREIRGKKDPKQSPAIAGLSALAVAGRASDMHEWLIAQLLTVASTGVPDSTIRTNAGIKAMVRHDPPGWAMAVGKHVPMPPPSTIPGRIHLVTGDGVRETQVPYLHLDDKDPAVADEAVRWARALAVSGQVAKIPTGPEGVPPELWPPGVADVPVPGRLALPPGAEQSFVAASVEEVAVGLTIAEALADGIFGPLNLTAARKRVQRSGVPSTGRRGDGSYTYTRADLQRAARDARGKDTAA